VALSIELELRKRFINSMGLVTSNSELLGFVVP